MIEFDQGAIAIHERHTCCTVNAACSGADVDRFLNCRNLVNERKMGYLAGHCECPVWSTMCSYT